MSPIASRLLCAALLVSPALASAQVASTFGCNFDAPNQTGTGLYCFEGRYAQSPTTWQTSHLPAGGWLGSGAARVVVHGCSGSGCSTSAHQFAVGWWTPPLGGTHVLGEDVFVRFRIRFESGARFPVGTMAAKFILYGHTGTSPNSRWIIHLLPPFLNQGCSLGFNYQAMGWAPMAGEWVRYLDWGLPYDFAHPAIGDVYGGFAPHVNISWSCAPSVLVSAPDVTRVLKPQNRGAAPVQGWYHLQLQAVSGPAGQADFRTWANNNDFANPSAQHLDMAEGLGVAGWEGGVNVGGYWGTAFPGSVAFVIDDFEVGPDFDPSWYPGGGTGGGSGGSGGGGGGGAGGASAGGGSAGGGSAGGGSAGGGSAGGGSAGGGSAGGGSAGSGSAGGGSAGGGSAGGGSAGGGSAGGGSAGGGSAGGGSAGGGWTGGTGGGTAGSAGGTASSGDAGTAGDGPIDCDPGAGVDPGGVGCSTAGGLSAGLLALAILATRRRTRAPRPA